jgi:hypothetical protein
MLLGNAKMIAGGRTETQGKSVMAEPLAEQIIRKVKQAAERYRRLMLAVAPVGAFGLTSASRAIIKKTGNMESNNSLR